MFKKFKNHQERYKAKLDLVLKKIIFNQGKKIFISSIPKSGSSFLVKTICNTQVIDWIF